MILYSFDSIAAEGNNLLQSSGGTEILAKDSIVSSSSFRSLLSPALPSFEGDLQINSSTAPILPVEAEGVIKGIKAHAISLACFSVSLLAPLSHSYPYSHHHCLPSPATGPREYAQL